MEIRIYRRPCHNEEDHRHVNVFSVIEDAMRKAHSGSSESIAALKSSVQI